VKQIGVANGHQANFLLNVSPNKQGRFQDASVRVLAEIGELLKPDGAGK
jgi:alpha-L-fucosidase